MQIRTVTVAPLLLLVFPAWLFLHAESPVAPAPSLVLLPGEVRLESRWHSLAVATYPSTIGVTALMLVALWPNPRLAGLLAGVLAGHHEQDEVAA